MIKINLSFAKIVATPTLTSWSQAYNAGNFFVVLSLTNGEAQDDAELTNVGKTIINNLEAEFFGLETKNLTTIKEAVLVSLSELPKSTTLSLTLAYLKDQVLYVLLYGAGNVLLKRENKTGTLLQRFDPEKEILSASGYIKQGDIILLRTAQFVEKISDDELNNALELTLPNDIAETLTPHIHNTDDGGAAAIVISITGVPAQAENIPNASSENTPEDEEDIPAYPTKRHPTDKKRLTFPSFRIPKHKLPSLPFKNILGNKKMILLAATACIIVVLLMLKITSTLQERKNAALIEKFTPIYREADEKYQEAQGIISLNPKLAAQIFNDALKLIDNNLSEFPENSDERNKLLSLKEKISSQVNEPLEGKSIQAVLADENGSPLLNQLNKNKDTISITENTESFYVLTKDAISEISKEGDNREELLENNDDWVNAVSIGNYQGNLYVLDKSKGVIKFVAGTDGYGKTDYFTTNKPDLSKTVSMAIDGSIWILSADGTISKYTRGQKDEFLIRDLGVLKKPVQIFTNADMDYLYVMDTGGGKIIQIQKEGSMKMSYRADILSNAKAFTVTNDGKIIYVLSDNKIWKLSL